MDDDYDLPLLVKVGIVLLIFALAVTLGMWWAG